MSQFGYCPLVWTNHSRTLNNRINGLHKKALSLVYKDFSSSLAYEISKVKQNMTPEILTEIFPQKESSYSYRNSTTLQGRSIRTVMYGSETISNLGPKIWDILPTELKRIVSPTLFKKNFFEWIPKNCSCPLCKTYAQKIGFL